MTIFENFIAGVWVEGKTAAKNINPSDTNDLIGEYAMADAVQTEDAIAAARDALPQWRDTALQARVDALDMIGTELLARQDELGELLSREEGKTRPEGVGEVVRAGQVFKFFAGEALRQGGEAHPSIRPGVEIEVTREPVGVVGAITPWNFPLAIPAWKIAPAMAYGDTIVFKPAALVPGSAYALAEIISRAKLPPGVFNYVNGPGREAGQTILDHPAVDAVTFTGSVETGERVLRACAARNARAQLEMGGKNPLVILDDADLDRAVNCALNGAFFATGQRCTASSRLIVTKGIADQFVDRLARATRELRVGHALEKDTQIGPLASAEQLESVARYVEIGREEGARLLAGGEAVECATPGFYYAPTLFDETTPEMRINREEIFGPVASIIRVADYEEALATANNTAFGLSAGVVTTSLKHAAHFKRHAQAGMVMVNLPTAGVDYHVPFGGRKASSFGPREQGAHAREFYTIVKTAYQSA